MKKYSFTLIETLFSLLLISVFLGYSFQQMILITKKRGFHHEAKKIEDIFHQALSLSAMIEDEITLTLEMENSPDKRCILQTRVWNETAHVLKCNIEKKHSFFTIDRIEINGVDIQSYEGSPHLFLMRIFPRGVSFYGNKKCDIILFSTQLHESHSFTLPSIFESHNEHTLLLPDDIVKNI